MYRGSLVVVAAALLGTAAAQTANIQRTATGQIAVTASGLIVNTPSGTRDVLAELTALSNQLASQSQSIAAATTSIADQTGSLSAVSTLTASLSTSVSNISGVVSAMPAQTAAAISAAIANATATAGSGANGDYIGTWQTQGVTQVVSWPENYNNTFQYYYAPNVYNQSTYVPLVYGSGVYSCNGNSIPVSGDASCPGNVNYAYFQANGRVHPGNADTYIVAAYTVPSTGLYALVDTMLQSTHACTSGVHLLVMIKPVNGSMVTLIDQYQRTALSNISTPIAPIGFLEQGSILYVTVGPDGSAGCDSQTLQFSLVRQGLLGLLQQNTAALLTALNTGHTANATVVAAYPSNWNLFTYYYARDISDTTTYTYMPPAPGGRFSCAGGPIPNTVAGCTGDLAYAFFSQGGGVHPGGQQIYVMAAFNVTVPGFYSIESGVRRGTGGCSDGTHLFIQYMPPSVTSPTWVYSKTCTGARCADAFNTPIGALTSGTQIQVALGPGPGSSNACDATILSFDVVFGPTPGV